MSFIARLVLIVLYLSALLLPAAAALAADTYTVYAPLTMRRPTPPLPNYRIAYGSMILRADGSTVGDLLAPYYPQSHITVGEAAWSPDGTTLAFWGSVVVTTTPLLSNNGGIYTIPADGHQPPRLVHPGEAGGPKPRVRWSPDGRFVAFTQVITDALTTSSLMVMHADGKAVQRVSSDLRYVEEVNWSPDSTQLVFTATDAPGFDRDYVYLVKQDGTQRQRIFTNNAGPAVWSPDGTKLAYTNDNGDIIRFNLARQQATPFAHGYRPTWSPDGTQLAYVDDHYVMVIQRDGSQAHPISNFTRYMYVSWLDDELRWSPDSTRLLARNYVKGTSALLLLSIDGSPPRQAFDTYLYDYTLATWCPTKD